MDSKDLSVYITRNTAGEITDHLVMSKMKTVEPKFRRGMTFSHTKKSPINTVSTNKFNYPFKFYEKNYKKNSLDSKFENKSQIAVSGTKHTVTTDKNKIIHRKLISNPLTFQQTTNGTNQANEYTPKHCRPANLLQNTRQTGNQRHTLHLQEERSAQTLKQRKKRGLDKKEKISRETTGDNSHPPRRTMPRKRI